LEGIIYEVVGARSVPGWELFFGEKGRRLMNRSVIRVAGIFIG
jgi:hypothetical protein